MDEYISPKGPLKNCIVVGPGAEAIEYGEMVFQTKDGRVLRVGENGRATINGSSTFVPKGVVAVIRDALRDAFGVTPVD